MGGFFTWPDGTVWPNVIASPACLLVTFILTAIAGWFLRHRIGRGLTRWAHKHWTALMDELDQDEPPTET